MIAHNSDNAKKFSVSLKYNACEFKRRLILVVIEGIANKEYSY